MLIQNPNWIPPAGQSPTEFKWGAEWVKSGAVTEQFKPNMPLKISDIKGMSTTIKVERPTILTQLKINTSGQVQVILLTRILHGDKPTSDELKQKGESFEVGRQTGDWEAYTDGAGKLGTKTSTERAGWSFVLLKRGKGRDAEGATIEHYGYGPVILHKSHPAYTGAIRCTNNTGELGAVVELLHCLLTYGSQPSETTGIIRTDSTYAAGVAMGRVLTHENLELAAEAARLWNKLRDRHKQKIYWRHVKGHSDQEWNDRVDKYADLGMQGFIDTKDPRWKTEIDGDEGEGDEGEANKGKSEGDKDESDHASEREVVVETNSDNEDIGNTVRGGDGDVSDDIISGCHSEAMGMNEDAEANNTCAFTGALDTVLQVNVELTGAHAQPSVQLHIDRPFVSIFNSHRITPKLFIQTKVDDFFTQTQFNAIHSNNTFQTIKPQTFAALFQSKIDDYFAHLNSFHLNDYFTSLTIHPPLSPTPIELFPRTITHLLLQPLEASVLSPSLNDPLPFLHPTPLYGMCVPISLRVAPNNVLRANDWWLCSPPRQPSTPNSCISSPHFSPPYLISPFSSGGERPYAAEQIHTQDMLSQLSLIPGPPSPRHSVTDDGFWSAVGRGVRNLLPGPWLAPSRLIRRVSHTLSRIFGTGNSKREAEEEGGAQCPPETGAHLGGRGLAPSLEGATCAPE